MMINKNNSTITISIDGIPTYKYKRLTASPAIQDMLTKIWCSHCNTLLDLASVETVREEVFPGPTLV